MTARAHVETDFAFNGVKIMVRQDAESGRLLRTWGPGGQVFVPRGEAGVVDSEQGQRPYLQLEEDEARAIYQALGEYFGTQVSDNRLLRADYEAERRRVDKFIEYAIAPPVMVTEDQELRR